MGGSWRRPSFETVLLLGGASAIVLGVLLGAPVLQSGVTSRSTAIGAAAITGCAAPVAVVVSLRWFHQTRRSVALMTAFLGGVATGVGLRSVPYRGASEHEAHRVATALHGMTDWFMVAFSITLLALVVAAHRLGFRMHRRAIPDEQ